MDARRLAYAFEHPFPYPAADGIDYIRPLAIAIKAGRSRYFSLRRPTLLYTHGPGFAEVSDARGEEAREFVLAGPAAAIRSRTAILAHVRERWGDVYFEEDIGAVLEALVADRLLYQEGNRYVTLAIPQRALHQEVCFAAQATETAPARSGASHVRHVRRRPTVIDTAQTISGNDLSICGIVAGQDRNPPYECQIFAQNSVPCRPLGRNPQAHGVCSPWRTRRNYRHRRQYRPNQ